MKLFNEKAICFALLLFANLSLFAQVNTEADWQWSVKVKTMISKETNDHPTAFLWIPPNCKQVKGVVIGQHNMLEEGILEHPAFRENLARLGFAEIWVTPAADMVYDFNSNTSIAAFNEMINSLADVSGYSELQFAPIIPIGHSAAASYPWNFAASNPSRTLAIISIHGDAPLTNMTGSGRPNPDWGNRNINGIPGLFVMGEYEWLEGRIAPAFAYRKAYPKTPMAYLCDAGFGHFDYSDELVGFLNMFITKAAKARLPGSFSGRNFVKLKDINPEKGWLVDRWRNNKPATAVAATFANYGGNKDEAGWAFDQEMASATESYYVKARGKKTQHIGYVQLGKVLSPSGFSGFNPKFAPLSDGLTFHLSTKYLDSIGGTPTANGHSDAKINITRICGPVIKINDSTFKIWFNRLGFNNPKRSGDVWFMARSNGDENYKTAVQQANMKIPIFNKEGKSQQIKFPEPVWFSGQRQVQLKAISDACLLVNYYVKDGPAIIKGDLLQFTKIPPRAKYPIKVTVVAWQYGQSFGTKIQSATPVEQVIYIDRAE